VLLDFAPELLTVSLSRKRLLRPTLIAGLQIEGMLFDIFDDVFLLNLPLEPAKSALDRLALLDFHFSHVTHTPFGWLGSNVLGYHT
jgi:hypothetical protein